MCLIIIGIRVPELMYIGSEVDIWCTIRFFRFLVPLNFIDAADGFYDALGLSRRYYKIFNTYYQYISPVGRFLEDLFSETSPDLMPDVSTDDIIHTLASAIQGWNPRSLMNLQIDDAHAIS